MAEQGTLNAKVQGSTPWQPTSHTISDERYLNLILPQKFRADTNISRTLNAISNYFKIRCEIPSNSLLPLLFYRQNVIT